MAKLGKTALKLFVLCTCLSFGLMFMAGISKAETTATPVITINPPFIKDLGGTNISLTVTVADVVDMNSYQVAIKYNGTVLNLTSAYYPDNYVFAGKPGVIPVEPMNGSTIDGLNYVFYGAGLLFGSVDVGSTPAVLFALNFTMGGSGASSLQIGTENKPIQVGLFAWDTKDTLLIDSNVETIPFSAFDGAVVVVGSNVAPVASFTIIGPPPQDNTSQLVLDGHPVPGRLTIQSYKGMNMTFDASASADSDGYLTAYDWNFGDGTLLNTTEPIVSYTYNETGPYTITLVVWDNGVNDPEFNISLPPLASTPTVGYVNVGLILAYYNWVPLEYAVLILAIAGLVFYVAKMSFNSYKSFRKKRLQQKMLDLKAGAR